MRAFQREDIQMEDGQLLVVRKYAGMAVQSARTGQMDLEHALLGYLAEEQREQGTVSGRGVPYLGVVHRLDQPVEGLLVFAKTREAAGSLSRQVQDGRMDKWYLAVVRGVPAEREGRLTDELLRDGRANLSRVVPRGTAGAKKAVLEYRLLETAGTCGEDTRSLLEIKLLTGRHHQIRVQMAHAGMPLLGDGRYGKGEAVPLALCAWRLGFNHPVTGRRLEFRTWPESEAFAVFAQGNSVDF